MTAGHRYSGPDAYIWQDCTSGENVCVLPCQSPSHKDEAIAFN